MTPISRRHYIKVGTSTATDREVQKAYARLRGTMGLIDIIDFIMSAFRRSTWWLHKPGTVNEAKQFLKLLDWLVVTLAALGFIAALAQIG
jgi:hypothetical protein